MLPVGLPKQDGTLRVKAERTSGRAIPRDCIAAAFCT